MFDRDPDLVRPARLADQPLLAPRPLNTALRSDKLSRDLSRGMPAMTDMMQRFKALRTGGYVARLKAMAEAD